MTEAFFVTALSHRSLYTSDAFVATAAAPWFVEPSILSPVKNGTSASEESMTGRARDMSKRQRTNVLFACVAARGLRTHSWSVLVL